VAQASITDQVFLVLALDAFSDVDGIDEEGMVGYETFRRFVTRIDYGARTVTLIDPKHFDPRGAGAPIHFDFGNHDPEVAGAFEGSPADSELIRARGLKSLSTSRSATETPCGRNIPRVSTPWTAGGRRSDPGLCRARRVSHSWAR